MSFSYSKKILLGRYVLKIEKADVYRLPYLASGGPGFGLFSSQIFFDTISMSNYLTTANICECSSSPIIIK